MREAHYPSTGRAFRTPAGFLLGWGTTVGYINGASHEGWAPGAIFIDVDAAAGQQHWVNEGTSTTASWKRKEAGNVDLLDSELLNFGTGTDLGVSWNGSYLQSGPASGLWAGCPSLIDPSFLVCHGFEYDFHDVNTLNYNFTSWDDGGTGTNVAVDVVGGAVGIVTANADNDYHAMASGSEAFLFASGKKLWMEARIRVAEASTNKSAWWIGFTDTETTGGFQADTSGPLASYDGALIWKDEADMKIDFETSNAAAQITSAEIGTFVTNAWTRVGMYFDGTATTSTITPYIDGVAGTAKNITLAGLAEMHFVMGIKAGPGNDVETLQVSNLKAVQLL